MLQDIGTEGEQERHKSTSIYWYVITGGELRQTPLTTRIVPLPDEINYSTEMWFYKGLHNSLETIIICNYVNSENTWIKLKFNEFVSVLRAAIRRQLWRNMCSVSKIWGFHSIDYEECRLLVYKISVPTSQETHYVSPTEPSCLTLCKIWGFRSCDYVAPCGSCKNRRFGGTHHLHHQGEKNRRARNNVSSN
jgi:hypothetical protein